MKTRKISILLVDDHAVFRQGLRALIEGQQDLALLGEAATSLSTLEQMRARSPQVVIMDIHLGAESGIDLSRRILAEFPETKIVVLSGDSNLTRITDALHAGVSGFVTKESGWSELRRAIDAVMDHQTYLSPQLSSVLVHDYMRVLAQKPATIAKPILTDRERALLKLVAEGARNKEIAEVLKVGIKSVETYRSRLMKKLGCASANELTRYALREGIASL